MPGSNTKPKPLSPFRLKWRKAMHNDVFRLIIGEFLFSFFVIFCISSPSYVNPTLSNFAVMSWCCFVVGIITIGPISGGVGNTWIAITNWWCRGLPMWRMLIIIPTHFVGGFVGAIALNVGHTDKVIAFSETRATTWQIISEGFCVGTFTFFLLQLSHRGEKLIFMICTIFSILIMSTPSGCIANAYIAFAKIFMNSVNGFHWSSCLYYILSQFIGMVIGIILGEYIVVEGERPLLDEELGEAKKSIEEEKKKKNENNDDQQILTNISSESYSSDDNNEKSENEDDEKLKKKKHHRHHHKHNKKIKK